MVAPAATSSSRGPSCRTSTPSRRRSGEWQLAVAHAAHCVRPGLRSHRYRASTACSRMSEQRGRTRFRCADPCHRGRASKPIVSHGSSSLRCSSSAIFLRSGPRPPAVLRVSSATPPRVLDFRRHVRPGGSPIPAQAFWRLCRGTNPHVEAHSSRRYGGIGLGKVTNNARHPRKRQKNRRLNDFFWREAADFARSRWFKLDFKWDFFSSGRSGGPSLLGNG